MQLPIGAENDFNGIVDLIEMNALHLATTKRSARKWDVVEIPADLMEQAAEYRDELIEAAVEVDDAATEAYLDGEMPDKETLRRLIRKGTLSSTFFPVFCGSAFKNKGVQPLLDGVIDFLPSPLDVPADQGHRPEDRSRDRAARDDDEPLSMLAFKIMNDPHRRHAHLLPHLFGQARVRHGAAQHRQGQDASAIGRMLLMHANTREEIKEAFAGDIVAIVGLKDTTTGDTLSDPTKPVILERMEFPEPVIEIAIEPNSKADQEKMGVALSRLAAEDPSFRVKTDEESGQTIIAGMGELHLDIIVDRMRREFKVEANVGAAAGRLSRDDHASCR